MLNSSYSISHHKRINPKKPFSGKSKNRKGNVCESLNPNKPVRFDKTELRKRVYFILNKEVCQVCEDSLDLDYPHHVEQGANKDDRYMINICVECHRAIHEKGYSAVKKNRNDCKMISWNNHLEYMEIKK